jgi:hypothetical protein
VQSNKLRGLMAMLVPQCRQVCRQISATLGHG